MEDEGLLLAGALASDEGSVLRRAFEHSFALGRGFASFHGVEITLDDLPELLPTLDAPCTRGDCTLDHDGASAHLHRSGCEVSPGGPGACDFYREALQGLLLGLSGELLHTRHASRGHGDGACVDVVYVDPESHLRFGPIPAGMLEVLQGITRMIHAFDSSQRIEFLGLSESVLYYRLTRDHDSQLCATAIVERSVRKRFTGLSAREVSSRPVLKPQD